MASVLTFLTGAALLIYSAEKLITCLVGLARGPAVSLFLLGLVFTGIEIDDLAFSVVLNVEDLEDVALGVVFGTVISMTGLALAITAIVAPSRVEVPKDYVVLFAAAPLVLVVPALLGELGFSFSIVLILLFVLFVVRVVHGESRRAVPPRSAEPPAAGLARSGWVLLPSAVLASFAVVTGAWVMAKGTEGIQERFAIGGTVFGATAATLVLSLEDMFLTAEPARRGAPSLGIGNVIGSVVFSVTAKVGIVALAGGALVITPEVFTWHLPSLVVINGFAAYALLTGHLRRWHGMVLLAGYVAYVTVGLATAA
ncbi:sodium:calcium antiporter [Streptomyces sp. NPDC057411]|uniref:sodium:calcium antiporter n=1 Tax=unclassified Streptomyces TaxID=2593676 RepID=UPI00362E39A7